MIEVEINGVLMNTAIAARSPPHGRQADRGLLTDISI